MSPQNDTPQDNDEARDVIESAIQEELALGGDPKSCASAVWEVLTDEGFEITKRSELGVTKGLPGIGDGLLNAIAGNAAIRNVNPEARMSSAGKSIAAENRDRFDLAAALELIGRRSDVVAVQLPEPNSLDVFDQPKWFDTGWDVGVPLARIGAEAEVRIETSHYVKPDQARLLAAALLAAANAAETENVSESVTCIVHAPDPNVCPVESPEDCCSVHACELDINHAEDHHKCFCGHEWPVKS